MTAAPGGAPPQQQPTGPVLEAREDRRPLAVVAAEQLAQLFDHACVVSNHALDLAGGRPHAHVVNEAIAVAREHQRRVLRATDYVAAVAARRPRYRRARAGLRRELGGYLALARTAAASLAGLPDTDAETVREKACEVLAWLDLAEGASKELTERAEKPRG